MTRTSPAPSTDDNPCLSCGACCRTFRVSFYWAEAEQNGIPSGLTEKVNDFYLCMSGTNSKTPRCAALGEDYRCAIYPQRSSTCREVDPGDAKCARARELVGLPALLLS